MAKLIGKLRRPESNRKKYIIISVVIAVVCLAAGGGVYFALGGNKPAEDEFGRRRFPHDANLPDTSKQSPKEIVAYMDSATFKNLTAQQRMHYRFQGGQKVMEYQMDTYFKLPATDRTAYLDKLIDQMQAMRKDMEQAHAQMPARPHDVNDPNHQARQQQRAARMANPSNARARGERGTPEQRAQRRQFRDAMEARMQQRGISMPGRGGGR